MGNEVPTSVRALVKERERGRCLRCSAPGAELCHRRSRSVKDEHTHCACNLWYGCHFCHQQWQHVYPGAALVAGFAVSRYDTPGSVAVDAFYARVKLWCDGDIEFVIVSTP